MARDNDSAVVVVTALTTFFATLFVALLILRGQLSGQPGVESTPDAESNTAVSAELPPPAGAQLAGTGSALESLRELGVRCGRPEGCESQR